LDDTLVGQGKQDRSCWRYY